MLTLLALSALRFLSHSVRLRLSACTQYSTFCALSLHITCSPPITKQTSETEQIPLHLHSSRLMLHRLSAHGSHCSFICNWADHPRCIRGVTDVPELTYWSGSTIAPTNLSILCASRTNRATAGSGVPRMKNNTQMAANSPRTGENFQHPSPHPTHTPLFSSFETIKLLFPPLFAHCDAMQWVHSVMYMCAWVGQLEYIHLSAPFVVVRNKEVNLTAVLLPSQVGTVTYIWWIGNNTEVLCTQGFPTSLQACTSFTPLPD